MNLPAAELIALAGVEHLGPAPGQRLRKRLGAKAGLQRVGQSPGHHVAAVPVHDCRQVEKAAGHGQIGEAAHTRLGRVTLAFLTR